MISIIIPWMHNQIRYPLFEATLLNLKNIITNNFEICIHEMGETPTLENSSIIENCKYMFTGFEGVFHRAWALNVPVKHLSTGDMICLMDSDIIVTKQWVQEAQSCNLYSSGFGILYYLSNISTQKFLNKEGLEGYTLEQGNRSSIKPKGPKGAGGITFFPRNLFFQYKGLCENFRGTWGGEDTATYHKFAAFGFTPVNSHFSCNVYHLYHEHKTHTENWIKQRARYMKNWDQSRWLNYLNNIGDNWGNPNDPGDCSIVTPVNNIEQNKEIFNVKKYL